MANVPSITVLRQRASSLLGRGVVRGQLKAIMAGAFAAKNAGTPMDPESTSQSLITECQGIINQADQDALAILVRELLEFVENSGGGGGGDAPEVIAPFPGIGAEGVFYSQQLRTTGLSPQSFVVTGDPLPTGWTINATTGVISGISPSPNGGLWTGEITVTNTAGDVVYPFSILVTGATPSITWPGMEAFGNDPIQAAVALTFTPTIGGSTHNGIVVDFTQGSGGLIPGLSMADATTGVITGTVPASEIGNYYDSTTNGVLVANLSIPRITNYFGAASTGQGGMIYSRLYYGNWHGALPGTFTAADIKTGLFNNTTPGPIPITALQSAFLDQTTNLGNTLNFPATGVAYFQVFALARGTITGTYWQLVYPGLSAFPCTLADIFNPMALSPAWPTPYQSGLVIDGVTYDVFVVAGGPTTSALEWGWNSA